MYIINSRMLSCDIMVIWISVLSGGRNGKRCIFGGQLDRAVHSTRIDLGVVRFWGERGAAGLGTRTRKEDFIGTSSIHQDPTGSAMLKRLLRFASLMSCPCNLVLIAMAAS